MDNDVLRGRPLPPTADWCTACCGDGPLSPWPLPNQWGDRGELICRRCWLARVRGGAPETCLDNGGLVVSTIHPLRGRLVRGIIRSAGIEPRDLRPVMVWRIVDHTGCDLGEHAGDFVAAQRRLLNATAELDHIETGD